MFNSAETMATVVEMKASKANIVDINNKNPEGLESKCRVVQEQTADAMLVIPT